MIAIVGAGITGLALAHELARRGAEFLVIEALPRPGGVIRAARVGGRLLEWGPQRARLTPPMRELVAELGLEAEVVTAPSDLPLLVYAAGRLRRVPFSAGAWMRSDLLGPLGRARALLEPLTGRPRADETVADYFTRKLGRQAYERLAGPLYGGLYASDPADMVVGLSLGHVLREFGVGRSLVMSLLRRGGRVSPPPACSFREGLAALPEALYQRHAARVRLQAPVTSLERSGSGLTLATAQGPVHAAAVVLTTPAAATHRLLSGLSPEAAERIGRLRYNPLAVVHLSAGAGVPRALGYQVALGEALRTRGVTFNASLFDRPGVFTAYLGGGRFPEVVEMDDERIGRLAADEFRQVLGVQPEVLSVAREAMPAWDRSWEETRDLVLPPGVHLATNWQSRPGLPGRLAQARELAERLTSGNPPARHGAAGTPPPGDG